VPVGVELQPCTAVTPDVRINFYRIAQEALNNVAKHSGASGARVTLSCEDGGARRVLLTVEDDGQGFDPAGVSGNHLGLNIMSERAEAIEAILQVRSHKEEGTRMSVEWVSPGPFEPA
jgi:signal transduction histidine kinase